MSRVILETACGCTKVADIVDYDRIEMPLWDREKPNCYATNKDVVKPRVIATRTFQRTLRKERGMIIYREVL